MVLEENWASLVENIAFPIVICLWFMFRMEKVINANTDATRRMIEALERQSGIPAPPPALS